MILDYTEMMLQLVYNRIMLKIHGINFKKFDTVSKSVSETVSHRSDDAKLIDKLKSQIKFITFVMQEYSKTYSTKDQAACNKALQTLDGRIHPGVAMMTAPFFLYVWFPKQ